MPSKEQEAFDELDETLTKIEEAMKDLEQSITGIVKEYWRLSLPFHYEATSTELEEATIGRDQ